MNPRILLINLPTSRNTFNSDNFFPVGLLSLGAVLKQNDIDTKIIDINNYYYLHNEGPSKEELDSYFENNLYNDIKDYKPDIIGIGCTFSGAFKNLKIIAQQIKNSFPETPIVTGGMHPTVFAGDILRKYNYIDYIIIGEGEFSFLKLVRSLVNNNRTFESIDGIAFRHNGSIKLNPKTNFIDNLDGLPHPDYSILNIDEYRNMDTSGWYSPKGMEIGQPFPIISSRSCPMRCTFCSMWLVHGLKFRPRSPEDVLNEMERFYRDYNIRYFQFIDDNVTFDKKRILEICKGILKRNMNIQFDAPNGIAINRLDEEIVDALVEAGMVKINIAIESGSEYIRNKVMKKGLPTEKIYEACKASEKHKHLYLTGYFIIGMPQETHETLKDTYRMMTTLPFDNYSSNFATPYPGTELFNYCLKHDSLLYKPNDYVDVEDLHLDSPYPHFKLRNLTIEELIAFQKKCRNYLKEKREASGLPRNVPFRYKEQWNATKKCLKKT